MPIYARVNETKWHPERVDEGIKVTEETIIPAYEKHPGFRGYFLLTEPGGDGAMAITMWDSEENMESSAGIARAMVAELKGLLQAPPETRHYEVMFNVQPEGD
jgi:quinol monooxygenase YgiN